MINEKKLFAAARFFGPLNEKKSSYTLLAKYYGKNDFHFCKLQSRYISMSETCNPYCKIGIFWGKSLHLPKLFSLFET